MATEPSILTADTKLDVHEFYYRYAECLDGGRLQQWPEFFADSCIYRVGSRKALRAGGDEDLISLNGKTSLRDRIAAIGQSEDYEPHQQRHFIANFRVQSAADDELRVQANFQVLRTFPDKGTEPFVCGYYLDRVVVTGRRLAFREKLCVLDAEIAPLSLVYPI
jgi:3-phenylpropionate/cinnamic acid dioxygenase small subunit